MAGPMERLAALEQVEKDILSCLQTAGSVLTEMAKEKPSQKQVDVHTNHFVKTLNAVEVDLGNHINYLTQVSTGQAHEGSSYAAQKTLQMAWHRSEHLRSKVIELERGRNQILAAGAAARQLNLVRGHPAGPGPSSGQTPPSASSAPPPTTTSSTVHHAAGGGSHT